MTTFFSSGIIISLTFCVSVFGSYSSSTDVRKVAIFVNYLVENLFPNYHLNVIYESNLDLSIWSDQLQQSGSNHPNFYTTTILNGNTYKQNWTFLDHRYTSWSWLNIVLLNNGNIEPVSLTQLIFTLKKRAVDHFLIDYSIFWQRSRVNSQLLYSPSLEKLKFKVEVILVDSSSEMKLTSICFYCNGGLPKSVSKYVQDFQSSTFTISEIFPDFTNEFHGKRVRLTGGIGIPLLMDFHVENSIWFPRGGFLIDPILFHLQLKMNLSFTTRVFNTFGSQLENGSFTGFVNELYNERADIGMAGQSYDRFRAVHFLDSIHIDSVSFATALPQAGLKWHAIIRAFRWDSWALFFGICFFIMLPLYIVLWKVNSTKHSALPLRKHLKNGFGFIFRPVLEQSLTDDLVPSFNSGRILMIFWLSTVLIVSVAYKTKLTSLMVLPEPEIVPNTFEELAQRHYKIILHHVGGALHKNIQSTTSPTFQKIAKRLQLEKSMYTCLLRAEKKKRTACVSYIHNLIGEICRNFTNANGISTLRVAPANVFMTAGSYMIPKSAIYKGRMNFIVANQIAFGFAKYAVDKAFKKPLDEGKQWARQRPELFERSMSERGPTPTTLGHVMAPFAILILTLTLAIIVFSIEKLFKKRSRRN